MDRQAGSIVVALEALSTAWIGKKGRSFFWSISSRQGEARFVVLDRFRSAPTAQQPALETQPREDIRRCRGDE
ncbi:BZ3500_MvSof-1268-A1-R1_Chr3-1g05558 [Microbotryum saponariae]|uniref:BZ3500_MvSof-1268-A1-R1_Chr3-1g05558 protein n=1 Tax=Microbotryum saponariae TaxID=289078 RepID=A0A2X0L1K4_9BASI|nr:BZ3500_MvSof-1268-A1-R1_Chr3-1g05558 [Microbotryum saponariae]